MKRNKVTRLLAVLLSSAMIFSVTACQGNSEEGQEAGSNQEEEQVDAEAQDDNETSSDAETDELSGKIVISTTTSAAKIAGWEALEQAYEEMHPDVDVVVDLKAADGYDQWLANVFSNNTTTDVDIVEANYAFSASADKLIVLSDYLENESPYSDGIWKDQFSYESQRTTGLDKSITYLNLEFTQIMWMYNKEIFEEAGVTEVPETWDELIAACEKIQAAGYQPISMAGDYDSFFSGAMGWLAQIYTDQTTRSTINIFRAQEGDYCYDPDIDPYFEYDPTDPFNDDASNVSSNYVRFMKAFQDGVFRADTEGMNTVWTNMCKVFPEYAGGDAMFGTDNSSAMDLFYQGKAAMIVASSSEISNYTNTMKTLEESGILTDSEGNEIESSGVFTLGTFPMPSMEGEGIEAKARTIEVSTGFVGAITKDQAHDELVTDFLMYYSSADGMNIYMDAYLAEGGAVSSPSLVYGVEYPEEIEALFENVEYIGNVQKGYGFKLARGFADLPESVREYYNNAYACLTGEITVEEYNAAQQAQFEIYYRVAMEKWGVSDEDLENPAVYPIG